MNGGLGGFFGVPEPDFGVARIILLLLQGNGATNKADQSLSNTGNQPFKMLCGLRLSGDCVESFWYYSRRKWGQEQ